MTDVQTYTFATVLINAADQAAAQKDFPEYFNTGASADGNAPATAFFTSGAFSNEEMDRLADLVTWKKKIRTADWQAALSGEGLQMIVPPAAANAD